MAQGALPGITAKKTSWLDIAFDQDDLEAHQPKEVKEVSHLVVKHERCDLTTIDLLVGFLQTSQSRSDSDVFIVSYAMI